MAKGKTRLKSRVFCYHIGNCAQNVRIFAYEIKVFLFVPQDWGTEGVEVLKTLFYINVLFRLWKLTESTMPIAIMLVIIFEPP